MNNSFGEQDASNIDTRPLGGRNLKNLLNKSSINTPSKGLESLITPTTTTQKINDGDLQGLSNKIEEVSHLSNKLDKLNDSLSKLISFKEENDLKTNIKSDIIREIQQTFSDEHKTRKSEKRFNRIVLAGLSICLLLLTLNSLNFGNSKTRGPTVMEKEPIVSIAKNLATKNTREAVTLKFVNLRSKGSSKGSIITQILPGQTVKASKEVSGWHKVSWRDKINTKEYSGWLYFQNIKFLE